MKTNYPLKSSFRHKSGWRRVLIPLSLLTLVLFIRIFSPQFLSGTFFKIAKVTWGMGETIRAGMDNTLQYLSSRTLLSREVSKLQKELTELADLVIQNRILREENSSLRTLAGRGTGDERILAGVIGKPPLTPFDVILLDAGKRDGIVPGMMVVSGKVFLGKVIETLEDVSKAELFSLGGKTLEGVIARSGTSITLKGRGGGNFEAEVPRPFDIEVGDIISLPGLETLVIADVLSVESDTTAVFKKAFLRTPLTIANLRFVEIRTYTEW